MPGRLEFLGKHTDYAGGRSLLCAIERAICLVAAPRADAWVQIMDAVNGERASFPIAPDVSPRPGHWSNYPMTVVRRLAGNFPGAWRGADIAFASDLPQAAGLSSSSALIVAFFVAVAEVNALDQRPDYRLNISGVEDLAGYLGTIENGQRFGTLLGDSGVGTLGGSEDHTAILCSQPRALSQYAFCPVRHERTISLPEDYVFVIAVSGVVADKTGAARERYNRAARSVGVMLEQWRAATGREDGSLAAALASAPDAPDRLREILRASATSKLPSHILLDRLEQFLAESTEIIPAVGDALARGDVAAIGPLVDGSQALAERSLQNQTPETIALARSACALGAVAASAFGAGFGGSVWAIVRDNAAEDFRHRWADAYRRAFPTAGSRSEFFSTHAGPGLLRL